MVETPFSGGWLIMGVFRRGEPCLGDDGTSEAKRAILDIVINRAVFICLVLTFAPAPAAAAFRVVIAFAKHSLEGSQEGRGGLALPLGLEVDGSGLLVSQSLPRA